MTGIYKITNNVNGKCYIGQSIDISERWKQHKYTSQYKNNTSYNYHLYRAMRKYGIENFSFDVLEECPVEKLNEREIYWIEHFNSYRNGYNNNIGGGGNIRYNEQNYCDKCGKELKYNEEFCLECYMNSVLSLTTYCDSRMVADFVNKDIDYINCKIKELSKMYEGVYYIPSIYTNKNGKQSKMYYMNRMGLMLLLGSYHCKEANHGMELLLNSEKKFKNIDFAKYLEDIDLDIGKSSISINNTN